MATIKKNKFPRLLGSQLEVIVAIGKDPLNLGIDKFETVFELGKKKLTLTIPLTGCGDDVDVFEDKSKTFTVYTLVRDFLGRELFRTYTCTSDSVKFLAQGAEYQLEYCVTLAVHKEEKEIKEWVEA